MKKKSISFLVFVLPFIGLSQSVSKNAIDTLYREDQIYFGITYNTLIDTPEAYTQTNFSPGLKAGFIRDFPINKKRNIAFGLGFGYALNISAQNLKITPTVNGSFDYEFLYGQNYQKNRFSYQAIEIPFEFRWRTSTAQSNKFWRIYTGFKASYVFASRTFFKANNETIIYKDLELNPWQYGLTLSAGYNNWNAFIYYGLNPIFETVSINQNPLEMKSLKVGLMFYIL
tara:strand:- start:580 stop:1263 length:684 start_codon:yes stop_codon:yes gene_type:complete